MIEQLLIGCSDPDAYFCHWWAQGVWVGTPTRPLPRTPAIFDRKTRWKFGEEFEEQGGSWEPNYSSTAEHAEQVKLQFAEEAAESLMRRSFLGEALAEYGDTLNLAAIGAIAKKAFLDEVRVIYDGSHGVKVN